MMFHRKLIALNHHQPKEFNMNGMVCHLCIKHHKRPAKVPFGKAVWVDIPCVTITKKSLNLHQKSDTHQEAMKSESDLQAGSTQKIEKSLSKQDSLNKQARIAAFRSLYWLAKMEIPHTTNYKPLMDFCELQGVTTIAHLDKGNNDKATSQRFLQEAMLAIGQQVQDPILQSVRDSPFYAVMIDETTDIQVVKEMIIYLRYIKDNSSMTNFVNIIPLSDGTAETIVHALTQFLAEHKLPVQKMCAIGSDGASVMVGKRNGVVAKLKELVPNLLSNHCVAHRLALAVSQSTKNLPYLKTFKDVLDQVFRFYRNSPVRMAALHEIQTVFDDPIIKPQQAKDVRWLSHDNATRTLAKCLPSVLASLEREAQERGDAQAMGLSVFIQNDKFIASLLMMRDILPHLSSLSKAMQARDAVYTTVQPMVIGTKALLENLKIIPGEHFKSATQTMEKLKGEGFNIKVPSDAQMNDFRCTDLAQHLGLPGKMAVDEWRQVKASINASKELQRNSIAGLKDSHPNLYKISCVGLLLPTSTADENEFRSLIVWLEDQKVRHYKIEDRAALRNTTSSDWPKALETYVNDLGCPYPKNERSALLDWLLGYAVRLEYGDDAEKFRAVKPQTLGSSSTGTIPAGGTSSNPLDALDFNDPDFKAGVTSLAMKLQIPPYQDHLEQLKAICIVVRDRLSKEAIEDAEKNKTPPQLMTLERVDLGFDTGDYIINEAAKILRLLHIRDLRELQSQINHAIVAVQTVTANLKTDSRLGKVGR